MIDYWQREKENAERWARDDTRTIGLDTLAYLAVKGFETCHYECTSRDTAGDYACACIRQLFPNEKTYECYQTLRDIYMELEMLGLLIAAQERGKTDD